MITSSMARAILEPYPKTNSQIQQNLATKNIQKCKLEVWILLDNIDNLINLKHTNWHQQIIVEKK